MRSSTDFWVKAWLTVGVAVHPKGVRWVEVRLSLYRPVKFFYTKLGKSFLYGAGLVLRGFVMLRQEKDKRKLLDTFV